ncbi:MAG: hypothetical protein WBH57_08205 [Anaerolineae bacterium]
MRKERIFHVLGKVCKSPHLRLIYILAALAALILAGGAPEGFSGGGG